jgi:hypothetical protein
MDEKMKTHTSSRPSCIPTPRPATSEDSTDTRVAGTLDRVKLDHDGTSYTNSGHWTSILDSITELRDELDQISTTPQPLDPAQADAFTPSLFFGRLRHVTKNELLAAVPPRKDADEMIVAYFASMDM